MNILYLLGNGFDVKLGLKTRFKDFLINGYTEQSSDVDLIKKLKRAIQNDIDTWADLEKKLGEYSTAVENETDYLTLFKDIRLKLADYIQEQKYEKSLQGDEYYNFTNSIRNLNQYLLPGERFAITQSNNDEINFITFNYTHSLESLLNYSNVPITIDGRKNNLLGVTINHILHIHGTPSNRFVMGVDNAEQIENKQFRSHGLLRTVVKPLNNSDGKELIDVQCKSQIDKADIICIFGMSLGETDMTWWQYIGKSILNRQIRLLLFWKDNYQISNRFQDELADKHDEIRDLFLSRTDLNEEQKKSISSRIYVVLNDERIFSYNVNGENQ